MVPSGFSQFIAAQRPIFVGIQSVESLLFTLPFASRDISIRVVMVTLSARQVHALDKICLEIRQTTGIKFKRSMLIRSIIDGFLEAAPNYDAAQSPADLKRIISQTVYPR